MFSGLPTLFPTRECRNIEDIFAREDASRHNALVTDVNNNNSNANNKWDKNSTSSNISSSSINPLYEEWVQNEVKYHESSYTVINELQVSVMTYNVASKRPTSSTFNNLITLVNPVNQKPIDLIVLSFQEVDMSAKALLWKETESMEPWVTGANNAIGADDTLVLRSSSNPYYALPPKQLVGMLVCLYLRRPLLPCLKEYLITTVATGTMRTMANKGAIGIRLVLHCTSLCIIAAHLASGQDNVMKRNEDINTILQNMDFNAIKRGNTTDLSTTTDNITFSGNNSNANIGRINNTNTVSNVNNTITYVTNNTVPERFGELLPRDHDLVIVAGDLNYRVNLTYEDAMKFIAEQNIHALLKKDQLTLELQNSLTPWHGFIDFTPTFAPTYRFDIGTSHYDTSEKHRVPSFTDRILIYTRRKSTKDLVHLDVIQSHSHLTLSDHKPVSAVMRLPISVEEPRSKQRVIEQLRENVCRIGLDRASTAMTRVDTTQLDFGRLQLYNSCECVIRTLNITNVGQCVAQVRTLRQNTNDLSEAAWLRVSPLHFAILPGESQEVMIEVKLQAVCMPWIAVWHPFQGQGLVSLDSFLLFCVRHGPVHAVECKAILEPSVFNNSLENIMALNNTPCIAGYALTEKETNDINSSITSETVNESNNDKSIYNTSNSRLPYIPKELWLIADAIARQPFMPGLFTESGDAAECVMIMKHIDSLVEPLPANVNPLSVAECLLNFLRNLQSPIVPYNLYLDALAAGRAHNAECLHFLQKLPIINANVWIYVMSLLNYLLRPAHVSLNKLSAPLLARVFSEALIPRMVNASTSTDEARYIINNNSSNNIINIAHNNSISGGSNMSSAVTSTNDRGGVNQQLRLRLEKERDDASALVEFFLTTPASLLRSYW